MKWETCWSVVGRSRRPVLSSPSRFGSCYLMLFPEPCTCSRLRETWLRLRFSGALRGLLKHYSLLILAGACAVASLTGVSPRLAVSIADTWRKRQPPNACACPWLDRERRWARCTSSMQASPTIELVPLLQESKP